ncbi:hypothetical protein F2Q68_00032419 [Brassica cretica]|uniref:Ion transport domain-containing protein n=1 Tax=Brassica cretica TaxID=69181 RepID=A0A8S9GEW7_BRACR|nr:hypothetical protein F2Q68_00032419 [Brassica cretica]
MAPPNEKDDVPMLPISSSSSSSRTRSFTSRFRSTSLANTSSAIDGFDSSNVVLGYTGPLQTYRRPAFVQMSASLPSTLIPEPLFLHPTPTGGSSHSIGVSSSQPESCPFAALEHKNSDDELGLGSGQLEFLCFVFLRLCTFFTTIFRVLQNDKCIMIDWPVAKAFIAVRSVTDVLFFVNIMLQFRLAYATLESTVVGVGHLFDHPRKIARNYLRVKFLLDLFIVMPLPQIWIFWILPVQLGASGDNYAKNFLTAAVLFQYIPKLCRLLPLLAGKTPTVFLFESACSFVTNILTFMLVGHVVGSCWYLFGLQRVNHCLRDACGNSHQECRELIFCGHGNSHVAAWKDNASAIACFQEDDFPYGIYLKAVNLTNHSSLFTRYIYSLLWGFQQISTLAGNQVPSYFLGEASFTMVIIALGLLLFPLLIGNMQNFLQALGGRSLEMSHKRFLEGIRGYVNVPLKWFCNVTSYEGVELRDR